MTAICYDRKGSALNDDHLQWKRATEQLCQLTELLKTKGCKSISDPQREEFVTVIRHLMRELAVGNGLDSGAPTGFGAGVNLSELDCKIVERLMLGETNAQIAKYLHYSESAVKKHISSLLVQFHVASRAGLVAALYRAQMQTN